MTTKWIQISIKKVKALYIYQNGQEKIAGKHRDTTGQDELAEFTSSDMLTLVTDYKAMII